MIRIEGPSFDDLDPRIEACERLVTQLAREIMAAVADELGQVRTAAGEPPSEPPPPPPGEPAVSLDTLALIATLWGTEAVAELIPFIGEEWNRGAESTYIQMLATLGRERIERTPRPDDPPMRSLAEDYLANAPNRVSGFSDDLWELARAQLLEGFMRGESIDKLRDRLRITVPQLSTARARTVARTEVISASNAGSLAMVEVAGFTGTKSWLATEDERTRPTHVLADGQTVPMQGQFEVGGSLLAFPGDPTGELDEIINCRCTLTYDLDDEPLIAAGGNVAGEWIGVLTLEGTPTGDGRMFAPGALTWADLPLPLLWQPVTGDGHDGSVIVGNITEISRMGNQIIGRGTFDLSTPEGADAAQRVSSGYLKGVSIDADNFTSDDLEYLYSDSTEGEPVVSGVIFHAGRIRGATLCAIPAFAEAFVQAVPETVEAAVVASDTPQWDTGATITMFGETKKITGALPATITSSGGGSMTITGPDTVKSGETYWVSLKAGSGIAAEDVAPQPVPLTAAAYVLTIPDVPPVEWFQEPTDVDIHGALTVTDEGRVYGYLAPAGVAHRSFKERVTVPMRNVDYSLFLGRETLTAGGGRVVTGALTMDCGHASTGFRDPAMAMDHYDNACSIVATVRIGENAKGVWVAGALVPGLSANQITRIMACQLSGDWRPHREKSGWREFAGALLVPVPGFAMARTEASVRMEEGQLVASAVPVEFTSAEHDCGCKAPTADEPSEDFSARMEELAESVGLSLASCMDTLRRTIHGVEA